MTEEVKAEAPKELAVPKRTEKRYQKTVRKKVVVEELVDDAPDPHLYEKVTFRFYNEEQRGVPVFYEWIDKWTKLGECKGYFYDGGTYTLPRVAFEYYEQKCAEPIYSNVSKEITPGTASRVSEITGYKKKYRLEPVRV